MDYSENLSHVVLVFQMVLDGEQSRQVTAEYRRTGQGSAASASDTQENPSELVSCAWENVLYKHHTIAKNYVSKYVVHEYILHPWHVSHTHNRYSMCVSMCVCIHAGKCLWSVAWHLRSSILNDIVQCSYQRKLGGGGVGPHQITFLVFKPFGHASFPWSGNKQSCDQSHPVKYSYKG